MSTWPFPKPNIPDPEHRLPFIWRQFVDPCDAPITVWAEALWPAFINALIVWYQVDLVQVLRTMFKPPLIGWRIRGGRHMGGRSRSNRGELRRGLKGVIEFDPSDYVGKALSPFADEEMVVLVPGEIVFYTATEILLIAAFEYQIFDVSTQFLYQWTSGVAKSKYCQARDDAVLYATAPGYPLQGIFGWDTVGILNPVKQRNIDFFNGFGVEQSVGPGVVGCTFGAVNIGGGIGPPWLEARMTCLTGPRAGSYASRRVSDDPNFKGEGGVTYDMQPGETWIGEIRVNGTWQISNPTLFCHARGTP